MLPVRRWLRDRRGDWAMRAKALSGLANLGVHLDRPDDALSWAEMALVRADRLTPVVRAVMHTRHARALGLNGRPRAADCMTAARQAEDYFAAGEADREPDWIRYYTPGHLERDLGRAHLYLALNGGDYKPAQQHLTASVARFPEQASRGKTLAVANLAHLTMTRDDPAYAVTLGHEALDSIGLARSDRVFQALRKLRAAGTQHQAIPAVRDLNQRLSRTLGALQVVLFCLVTVGARTNSAATWFVGRQPEVEQLAVRAASAT